MQREMLLKAAKSRSKAEDPEQAKLKAKAKEVYSAHTNPLDRSFHLIRSRSE